MNYLNRFVFVCILHLFIYLQKTSIDTKSAVGKKRADGSDTKSAVGKTRGDGSDTKSAVGKTRGDGSDTKSAVGKTRGDGPKDGKRQSPKSSSGSNKK